MRILGGNSANAVGQTSGKKRTGASSGNFSVPKDTAGAQQGSATSHSSAVQDVSSLLALQGVEDSLHGRRKKAVRRGNRMLDMLEEVRLGLLSGSLPIAVLKQLDRLSLDEETSGDERIDELLAEIGLRAQVEIAKLERKETQ